jgi:hypothetical protein
MDLDSPVNIVTEDSSQGSVSLVTGLGGGLIRIQNSDNQDIMFLGAGFLGAAVLTLGGAGTDGSIRVENAAGETILLVNGRDAEVELHNDSGETTVRLNGRTGDVILVGADAAEDFEVVENGVDASPGTVMVIEHTGRLRESTEAYDRRVAGIIAGTDDHRPGIILGRHNSTGCRKPIALAGRTWCKVDATSAPIGVGDLLTSSMVPGHAMKATDSRRAFGSVIGKALRPLPNGQALIPVLVALQ